MKKIRNDELSINNDRSKIEEYRVNVRLLFIVATFKDSVNRYAAAQFVREGRTDKSGNEFAY